MWRRSNGCFRGAASWSSGIAWSKARRTFQRSCWATAAQPSAAWKLLVSYNPAEAVLWLAFSSKTAQVKEKFNNFFNVWPEARQKIPTTLMAEMRITPDLPNYGKIAEKLFFEFMDGKLQTEEEIRRFLEPYSPPAPPPPVVIRRPRGRRAEPKIEEEEEVELPVRDSDEEGEEEEEDERAPSPLGDDVPLPPKKGAAPMPAKAAAKAAKGAKAAPAPCASERCKGGDEAGYCAEDRGEGSRKTEGSGEGPSKGARKA